MQAFGGRRLLVVVEIALAVILLAGSGLMIRSLAKLLAIDPGFDARHVLTVRMSIPRGGITADSAPLFYDQLLARVRAVPGVADAAMGNCAPLNGGCNSTRLELMDRPKVDFAQMPSVGVNWTSPTWFSALHIPLKLGRVYASSDRVGTPKVVVINETAAQRFWPSGDALGKRVGVGQGGFSDGAEVIGIVGDVRQFADSQPRPEVYIPYLQSPQSGLMLFVRASGEAAALTADVRGALREIAPRSPAYDVETLTARAAAGTAPNRFSAELLALFAATALSLAAIGIYGVMSLAVSARTREIGVRIALGADRAHVQRVVVGEGLVLVMAGAALGIAGALASTRVLRSLLFDLTPSDPPTYIAIVVILGACALAASWLPARRASRVDPVTALRSD
jgi:predicted permease